MRYLRALTASLLLLLVCLPIQAVERFPYREESTVLLSVGAIETLRMLDITRIAVGNEDIVSVTLLNTDELLIIPLAQGNSDVVVWHLGNRKTMLHIQVNNDDPIQLIKHLELLTQDFANIALVETSTKPMLTGFVNDSMAVAQLEKRLESAGIKDQVTLAFTVATHSALPILADLLSHIEGLSLHESGDNMIINGSYDPIYKSQIERVLTRFPSAVNVAIENPAPKRKMIEISVQILEIKKRQLDRLGIRWQEILSGPSIAMAQQAIHNPYFSAFNPIQGASELMDAMPLNDGQFYGAIGMATQIQSQIELLTETGGAKVIARPMLSTTENSAATFHSGGQIPYPLLSDTGELRVQYQPYGIRLNILPTVGHDGNILVDFSAEVSSIDHALSVNGVPGLAMRQVTSVANTQPGQMVIISGLVSQSENSANTKLPWFGDLPILGRFFRSKTQDDNQQELLIMLTPTVADADNSSELTLFREKFISEFTLGE